MRPGTFILRRFNGDEVYQIESATIALDDGQDGVRLTFVVKAAKGALQTVPDTVTYPATPNAEVAIMLPPDDINKLVGRQFMVPTGYDSQQEEYVATIYYYEHEVLDNNVIDIFSHEHDAFHVRWTATTLDVNYYDGSKPDTQVEIDGMFRFDRHADRG